MKKLFALLFCAALCGVMSLAACASAGEPKVSFSENTGDRLRIITLSDNVNTGHTDVEAEFGLSVLIQKGDTQLLFDTGKGGKFVDNARKMNVDLNTVKSILLSHAHYDHCGGLMRYLNEFGAEGRTLYIKDCFFEGAKDKCYDDAIGVKLDFTNGTPGYFGVGIDFTAEQLTEKGLKINYLTENMMKIADGITAYGSFTRVPLDPKMQVKVDDTHFWVDNFDEELAVAIDTSKGLVIITGCSHTGVVNIVKEIQQRSGKNVYAVIGGYHLLDSTEKQIQDCINLFKKLGIKHLGLAHCIGPVARKMFLEQLPELTYINSAGSVFEMK